VRRTRSPFLLCIIVLVGLSSAHALGELERSPFAPFIGEFIIVVHGVVAPCDVVVDRAKLCFSALPGSVATVAQELESIIDSYGGALMRSPWRSMNGVHRVDLTFEDDLWGALQLWLSEPGDGSVKGMLTYVTHRRTGR
jgi:hypothetical protein